MAEIREVVQVTITAQPSSIPQTGFGVGLLLLTHLKSAARYELFTSLAGFVTRHTTASPGYAAAAAYFGQSPAPASLAVGRRQVNAVTVTVATAANSTAYTITLNGTAFTITSDSDATTAEVATALRAAINAGAEPITASGSGSDVILTHDVAGTGWSVAIGDRLTLGTLTPAGTIGDDLTAVRNENPDFYGVFLGDRDSASMQAAATWVQANDRILFAATAEANSVNVADASDTATLGALMKAGSYSRVSVIYGAAAATEFPDAALAAKVLPYTPGAYTSFLKPLALITADNLTPTQSGNALDKYVNTLEPFRGLARVREGRTSSGNFIDQIHGRDWLKARLEEAVFALIDANAKIPFTDTGISAVENAVKGVLQQGVDNGYLLSYSTQVPAAASVSSANRGNRHLPDVRFTAVESGAIHTVDIQGSILV